MIWSTSYYQPQSAEQPEDKPEDQPASELLVESVELLPVVIQAQATSIVPQLQLAALVIIWAEFMVHP